jgi:anti-sigma-K factor RskA
MNHLSQEELIELYYSSDDGQETARHLDTCPACARTFKTLQADLAEMKAVDPPARPENYGVQVWNSISDQLPAYASHLRAGLKRPWFRQPLWIGLSAAATCVLLVSAAFYAGRLWEHRNPPPPIASHPASPAQQRVVVVVLSDHLDRSERLLVQLKHANADDTQLAAPLRDEARSLLAANRKCRQEAEASGDPALTKALDHLNELLTGLANQPGGLNADAISRLQAQMDKDGLLFEVRVLRSRIPSHHAAASLHLKGGIA